jgi:hypothetical protein
MKFGPRKSSTADKIHNFQPLGDEFTISEMGLVSDAPSYGEMPKQLFQMFSPIVLGFSLDNG